MTSAPTVPYKTTVSVAATSYDLTDRDTVKQELRITNSNSDDFIDRLISEQSAVAATYCGRVFAQETLIDTFRLLGETSSPLILSSRPLASITSIVENGITLTTDEYEYDVEAGFVWRLRGNDCRSFWCSPYWSSPNKIVVTFVAGYDLLDDLPLDISRAVLSLIKRSYFSRTRDPMAKAEEVQGIGRTEYWVGSVPGSDGLPAEAVALLDPYREVAL